jgi:hypothetical protein
LNTVAHHFSVEIGVLYNAQNCLPNPVRMSSALGLVPLKQ